MKNKTPKADVYQQIFVWFRPIDNHCANMMWCSVIIYVSETRATRNISRQNIVFDCDHCFDYFLMWLYFFRLSITIVTDVFAVLSMKDGLKGEDLPCCGVQKIEQICIKHYGVEHSQPILKYLFVIDNLNHGNI